jgi:hypothetical protein
MNLENNLNELEQILDDKYIDIVNKQQLVMNTCLQQFCERIKWDGPKLEANMNNEDRKLEIFYYSDDSYLNKNSLININLDWTDYKIKQIKPVFFYNESYEVNNFVEFRHVIYKLMYYIQSILDEGFININTIFKPVIDTHINEYNSYLEMKKLGTMFRNGFNSYKNILKLDEVFDNGEAYNKTGRDIPHNEKGWVFVDKIKMYKNPTGTYVVTAYWGDELKATFTRMSEVTLEQTIRNFMFN